MNASPYPTQMTSLYMVPQSRGHQSTVAPLIHNRSYHSLQTPRINKINCCPKTQSYTANPFALLRQHSTYFVAARNVHTASACSAVQTSVHVPRPFPPASPTLLPCLHCPTASPSPMKIRTLLISGHFPYRNLVIVYAQNASPMRMKIKASTCPHMHIFKSSTTGFPGRQWQAPTTIGTHQSASLACPCKQPTLLPQAAPPLHDQPGRALPSQIVRNQRHHSNLRTHSRFGSR